MHPKVAAILAERGVVTTAEFPKLGSALARLKRSGLVTNPLPGTFIAASDQSKLGPLRAVSAWAAPNGVVHGRSAASIWLPELATSVVELAHPSLRSRPGVVVCQRLIPPEFVVVASGVRMACPAYAAVELAATDDGRACCEALRRRLAVVADFESALASLSGSRDHRVRKRVVEAAMSEPWSYAELRLHRILRAADITDWIANSPLRCGGQLVFPDIRFRNTRLILEFDGRSGHTGTTQFLADRERQNLLEAASYHVLRFGWEHLDQPDYVIATVRQALRAP